MIKKLKCRDRADSIRLVGRMPVRWIMGVNNYDGVKSPITKKTYSIPAILNDRKVIEKFLERNHGKKVIVVQGLGFVGAVMALVCANSLTEEYAVIGVDLADPDTFWKIGSINEGIFL